MKNGEGACRMGDAPSLTRYRAHSAHAHASHVQTEPSPSQTHVSASDILAAGRTAWTGLTSQQLRDAFSDRAGPQSQFAHLQISQVQTSPSHPEH